MYSKLLILQVCTYTIVEAYYIDFMPRVWYLVHINSAYISLTLLSIILLKYSASVLRFLLAMCLNLGMFSTTKVPLSDYNDFFEKHTYIQPSIVTMCLNLGIPSQTWLNLGIHEASVPKFKFP